MTAQTPTVLKSYFDTGDRPTASQYGDFIDTACGYKSYVALLTQSGTAAPVATVLQNTLGGSVVWTRSSEGVYIGTAAGLLTDDKTTFFFSKQIQGVDVIDIEFVGGKTAGDNNAVSILTFNNGEYRDSIMGRISVEIRVYP